MKRILMTMWLTLSVLSQAEVKPFSVINERFCGQTAGSEIIQVCLSGETKVGKKKYLSVTTAVRTKHYGAVASETSSRGGVAYEGTLVLPLDETSYDVEHVFQLLVNGKNATLKLTHRNYPNREVTEFISMDRWQPMIQTL